MSNNITTLGVDQRAIMQAGQGWTQYAARPQRRMIVATQAPTGTGKTHFAMTMPGPVAVLNMDDGLRAVADKFAAKGKKIAVKDFLLDPTRKMTPDDWDGLWSVTEASYMWAVSCGQFRSVFIDTGNALWEYKRMEKFGRLAQVPPLKYTEANNEFEALIRYAYGFPVNVCLSHRMKEEYVNDAAGRGQKTGNVVPTGYSGINYVVETAVRLGWHLQYNLPMARLEKCRQDKRLDGRELFGTDVSWAGLGKLVYPGSADSDWSDGTEVGL